MKREIFLGSSFLLLAAGSPSRGALFTLGESSEDYLTPVSNDADTTASIIPADTTDANDLSSPTSKDYEGSGFTDDTISFAASTPQNGSTDNADTDIQSILMFAIPALALLLIIVLIVIVIVKCHQRKKLTPDMPETEDIKSPIFEDDLPSVMEIEMEELDQWMNSLQKNAESEQHFDKEDEKKMQVNLSDSKM